LSTLSVLSGECQPNVSQMSANVYTPADKSPDISWSTSWPN